MAADASSVPPPAIALLATPLRAAVAEGRDVSLDVLVRIQAPDAPEEAAERSPLELALVIDRSGSMFGEPLEEAMRCAEMIVDHLGRKDRVAVVHFGSDVTVASRAQEVADRAALKQAIRAIGCDGMTALHGGWLAGAEAIAERANAAAIARILLLSDGCANEGLTDPDTIAAQADELRKAGVSTSTYGLGRSFDERLMQRMSASGGGNAYYGKTAQDLLGAFREEFDLLSALCAREVRLKLRPAAGVMVEVRNGYPRDGAAWRLPDLAYEGEAWAMLRVTFDAETASALENETLVEITASAVDLAGRPVAIAPIALAVPVRTPAAVAALEDDPLVARRLQELAAVELEQRARQAAQRGDWSEVDSLFAVASATFADSAFLSRSLEITRSFAEARDADRLGKEVAYRVGARTMRLVAKRESLDDVSELERVSASFMRRKVEEGVRERAEAPPDPARGDVD